jgi:hypothetical protein
MTFDVEFVVELTLKGALAKRLLQHAEASCREPAEMLADAIETLLVDDLIEILELTTARDVRAQRVRTS